ncbi:uncharacterized protein LOC101861107 [Aplysia californica]|uniref:Uncharacterized protein LOC101861107 n=1 Tax=Aplysia californica TaxID=6500 RepID=A0ABM0JHN0_APLCA|nr:uncharacterized protein LOC101861107 [Aplysia californica]
MSRGIKDLRDLICVSRLTFHESEEEYISDNERRLSREISSLSLTSNLESPCTTNGLPSARVVSPDSGFVTNGSPSVGLSNSLTASADCFLSGDGVFVTDLGEGDGTPRVKTLPAGTASFTRSQKKKRRKRGALPTEPTRHELPRSQPLPPVSKIPGSPVVSEHEIFSTSSIERVKSAASSRPKVRVNFDDMLTFMDATIVANWLTRSNDSLHELTVFCEKGDNFVRFAHFWLNDFPDLQKRDIFSMEYDFLLEEMTLAFAVGRESGAVVRRDLLDMCGAVFKEYPVTLLGAKGPHLFLNYLDILASEKHEQYRVLLADVRCSTSNRQYAQWLLATRSFALVNVWSSIINFYRNLIGDGASQGLPIHELCSSDENVQHRRMLQAIRLGYISVIHYLIVNKHVNPSHSDSHRRSLIFSAVMHNQPNVLKYLVNRVHPAIEINLPADTGNTALHAAANSGNLVMVEILCGCEGLDLNCVNPQCERATPLHLAAMHGHEKIVECLLRHGANPHLKMGSTTVRDLARDFEHTEILDLLDESYSDS